ncbi:Paf1 complex component [Coemansia sp. Benny D115]|nr:Paf1 complex component [Coemansia sp. Benny D115]
MSDLFGSDVSDTEGNARQSLSPPRAKRASATPEPQNNDLFGSDSEDEPRQRQRRPRQTTPPEDSGLFGSDDDDDDGANEGTNDGNASKRVLDEANESGGEMDEDLVKVKVRVMSAQVPVLPVPQTSKGQYILARAPHLLRLDPTPFTRDTYEDIIGEEHMVAEKHGIATAVTPDLAQAVEGILANTIRWRRLEGGRRESNARLVRWSDGSTTVVIGGPAGSSYSVGEESLRDHNMHAAALYPTERLLHTHAQLTDQWYIRPSRQTAQSRLAISLLLDRMRARATDRPLDEDSVKARSKRMRFIMIDEDPELMARRVEQEEEMKERQRRKEERMRENQEMREMRAGRGDSRYRSTGDDGYANVEYSDDDEDTGYGYGAGAGNDTRHSRARDSRASLPSKVRKPARNSYVDDEFDDFVVDDDEKPEIGPRDEFDDEEEEEEELARRRLNRAKNGGYDDEDSDGGDARAGGSGGRSGKSRRLIYSDDDDDDDDGDDM